MATATLILNQQQIEHKIRRISYQIYESNIDETEIVIAGIATNGIVFANRLREVLQQISPLKIITCEVHVDKKNPRNPVKTTLTADAYTDKSVVLVDDVLNSGSTLIYGVKHFLDVPLKKFQTAVLVDRSHKRFPVKSDFKGISLSTSLSETVDVHFSENSKVELR